MSVGQKKSILVIDDDITIRKLISHHLNLNHYKVYLASNTDEGFDQLYNNKIDLVLCDVTMDNMDGFTFCQIVRENKNYRSIPFVFVTAKNTLEDKSRALEVGGDDFITKPFNVEELIIKVKALIRKSEIYLIYGTRKNLEESFSKKQSRIVLIDDDEGLAKLLQFNLNKVGIECKVAHSAKEGYKLVESVSPDLIIADIVMPGIDGFEFREMLLKNPDLASIPFVFLSHKGSEKDVLDGYKKDITDYIIKNEGPKVFVAKVSAILKSLSQERKKIVAELHQAADTLRTSVVPLDLPEFENFNIQFWHEPFSGIPGGDFIDHFTLDENHIAIVIGDVMGKKWGAWYFAFAYAGYIRSSIRSVVQEGGFYSPARIISKVNNSVYQDSKISEVFSTLSVVVLDNKEMILNYSGAGDLPIFYKKNSENSVTKIESKGLLLGFNRDSSFEDTSIKMNKGDVVFLTTDGIIESLNIDGEQLGSAGLIEIIKNIDKSESSIISIKNQILTFTSERFDDDISFVMIESQQ
jgi:sigma-B regulation protein RsbU (phosphoserine phosphatase)